MGSMAAVRSDRRWRAFANWQEQTAATLISHRCPRHVLLPTIRRASSRTATVLRSHWKTLEFYGSG